MAYTIAGIDVHKRMLAVVAAELAADGEDAFERRQFGSTPAQLRLLADWLSERQVDEVVMESTAQYWKPVWAALERHWTPRAQARAGAGPMAGNLHLAHARSNRARRGRQCDFADAERLVKRLVAQELILSFVPAPEQRLWRTVTRTKVLPRCGLTCSVGSRPSSGRWLPHHLGAEARPQSRSLWSRSASRRPPRIAPFRRSHIYAVSAA
jgi:hypothetical protein